MSIQKIKYIGCSLIGMAMLFGSCKQENILKDVEFNVTTSAATYKVGDRVQFNFTGNPDIISFYSGEIGNDFAYLNGRSMPASAAVSFYTSKLSTGQPDQLEVLVSSDFNGVYTLENVQAATWVPITTAFNYATGTTEVFSKEVQVNGFVPKKDNIYIGFRYKTKPRAQAGNLLGTRWRITNLSFLLTSEATAEQVALAPNSFMKAVTSSNYETNRVRITSAYIEFNGNATATGEATEGWLITNSVLYNGFINYGPDKSKQVKTIGTPRVDNFSHAYIKPGVYNVVFTAANATVDGSKQLNKQMQITITP